MTGTNRSLGTDAHRIHRLAVGFVGTGYFAYLILLLPTIRAEAEYHPSWWTPTAVGLVFLPGIALIGAALRDAPRLGRWCIVGVTVGYLVAVGSWPLTWSGELLPGWPWLSTIPALASLAAATAWRPRWVIGYLLVAVTGAQLINLNRLPDIRLPFLVEEITALGYCLIVTAAMLTAIRTGRILDETRNRTHQLAAAAAAMTARDVTRRTHAGLLHDWVMSTLLAAARRPHTPDLRRQAQITLAKLARVGTPGQTEPIDSRTAVATLCQAAVEAAMTSLEPVTGPADPITRYPADVVDAIAAGIAEAVRNSGQHAGTAAICNVHITAVADRLSAEVVDDGDGFEPGTVLPDRYGVADTIRRLEEVPGGAVTIRSAPGAGTSVRFVWTAAAGAPQQPADARTLLGMNTPTAWLITGLLLIGVAGVAATYHPDGLPVWRSVAAVCCLALSAVGLLTVRPDPLPWPYALGMALGSPVGLVLICQYNPHIIDSVSALWPGGFFPMVYAFMCVRGRLGFAWAAAIVNLLLAGMWADQVGLGFAAGVLGRILDLGPVLMGTFFAYTLRPAAAEIYRLRTESIHAAADEAATAATIRERTRQLARLDDLARTLLTRIANDHPLIPAERHDAAVLEAHLRATLRAPGLVDPLVNRAVHNARERGVDVLLYDEHGLDDTDDAIRERILRRLAVELDAVTAGTVAIRIPPPDRQHTATFVASTATGTRRIEFDHRGGAPKRPLNDSGGGHHPSVGTAPGAPAPPRPRSPA